ncbi:MAG TPA: ParB/RepB/Spo0J family partition protein [Alphaproteobacteria bacterium]|nr:ParB/RepB/Spo0J family partition protein [Alphaproteobacteria bacterium]
MTGKQVDKSEAKIEGRSGSGRPKALGRGLAALLGDLPDGTNRREEVQVLAADRLMASPLQPRRHFGPEALSELAASIKAKGIIQPLVVRPSPDEPERFEIIAGERRWRAAQEAGLTEIPAVVRPISDRDALAIALVENLQRENLSPIEEAEAYRRLIEEYTFTQESVAEVIGKSRVQVTNTLRLLRLPPAVREMLGTGLLSAGHGRALVGSPDAEELAHRIVRQGLTVRQAEKLAKEPPPPARSRPVKDPNVRAVEREIAETLGLRASLKPRGDGSQAGSLTLHYLTLDQLDGVLSLLRGRMN